MTFRCVRDVRVRVRAMMRGNGRAMGVLGHVCSGRDVSHYRRFTASGMPHAQQWWLLSEGYVRDALGNVYVRCAR